VKEGPFHPLSKFISGSSSNTTLTTATTTNGKSSDIAQKEGSTRTGTIKNKTSMLSFSGLVSSLWSSTPSIRSSQDATIIKTSSITTIPPNDSTDITPRNSNSDDTVGVKTGVVDRNEDIKGWLRQTFDASNAYMNDARKTIEAARMAIGSPESKIKKQNHKIVPIDNAVEVDHKPKGQNKNSILASTSTLTLSEESEGHSGDGDGNESESESLELENDLPLSLQERRQATTSTLESDILETPTCSPITINHPSTISKSLISHKNKEEIEDFQAIQQHEKTLKNNPLYSPPLRQLHQMEPIINHQVTYFDSPLMRKKMNRISLQTRQEAVLPPLQRFQQEQDDDAKKVQYPPSLLPLKPSSSDSSQEKGTTLSAAKQSDLSMEQKIEEKKKSSPASSSAEILLRGTWLHAISESVLRKEDEQCDDTLRRGEMPIIAAAAAAAGIQKGAYRPSIASIFGIPLSFTSTGKGTEASTSEAIPSNSSAGISKKVGGGGEEGSINRLKESVTESLSSMNTSTSTKDTVSDKSGSISISNSTSSATGIVNSITPKLLRKTASKHTLRKAASPILSTNNSVIVHRDDGDEEARHESLSPIKNNAIKSVQCSKEIASNESCTPVKSRTNVIRGPVPIRSSSTSPLSDSSQHRNIATTSTTTTTPRQIAHRNPRDSPIGETKVIRSPPPPSILSKRYTLSQQQQQQQSTPIKKVSSLSGFDVKDGGKKKKKVTSSYSALPGIMDDENDDNGLWSPPKNSRSTVTSPSKRAPLGERMQSTIQQSERQKQNEDKVIKTSQGVKNGTEKGKDDEIRPRLKAKESLERLLAFKQMQEENSSNRMQNDVVPPVPAIPLHSQRQGISISMDKKQNDNGSQAASDHDTAASMIESDVEGNERKKGNTIKHKSSFGGTLRGFIGSAVAGWTDLTPVMTGERNAPVSSQSIASSSSSSRRVTILPSPQKPSSTLRSGKNGNSTNRGKSVRRAKSMYVDDKGREMGDSYGRNSNSTAGSGSTWIAMERDRNSLILPTIIISDYTHD